MKSLMSKPQFVKFFWNLGQNKQKYEAFCNFKLFLNLRVFQDFVELSLHRKTEKAQNKRRL